MSDYNHVGLFGRLTRDAEIKKVNDLSILSFPIVINRRRKRNENWISEGSFFNLHLFGKRAEGLYPYLKKGQRVVVGGHLEQRTWEKEGERRSTIEIVIDTIDLTNYLSADNEPQSAENSEEVIPENANNKSQVEENFSEFEEDFNYEQLDKF